jgi:hypothetical protein
MTPEHVLTVIELALYRVSDRLKAMPQGRPVSADAVAVALRWVGEEITAILKGHEEAKKR